MDNLKTKSVLVYDFGLFTELAASLLKTFKHVYYFVPWQDDFPSSKKQKIGMDFRGLDRIQDFWDYVDKADMIVSFDTYSGDLVTWLRSKGYRVWGAGQAEDMELQRWQMRVMQKNVGLPFQETARIKSLDDLITYFKGIRREVRELLGKEDNSAVRAVFERIQGKYKGFSPEYWVGNDKKVLINEWLVGAKNKFVKANMRGDIESFYVPDYDNALSKFNHLAEQFGHRADSQEIEFVIEEKKEGVEPGFDGIQINGAYLSPTMYGYERKGAGYIGRICEYQDLPNPMKALNASLSVIFRKFLPTMSFFSNEFMIDKNKKPYLIDPTVRNPAPVGSAIYSELIENLGEILWYGAAGVQISPVMRYQYAAGVNLDSEWAKDHELEIEVDPAIDRWVKFRKAYQKKNKYYAVPGFTSICSVIALGNSVDEVVELVKKRVEKVKAYELQTETGGLDLVKEEIANGLKCGITF
jgi:hypothetical protein